MALTARRDGGVVMPHTARDVMNRDVICVPEDMDLRDLARLFLEKGITGAPVLDRAGDLAGVISQTDLLYYQLSRGDELTLSSDFYQNVKVEGRHVPAGFQVEDVNSERVADVMTPLVHSIVESATIESAARMMIRRHIHRVIVRKGRKVAGILSALDVIRVLMRGTAAPEAGSESRASTGVKRGRKKRAARR
jgi:CBS domain-containing protein